MTQNKKVTLLKMNKGFEQGQDLDAKSLLKKMEELVQFENSKNQTENLTVLHTPRTASLDDLKSSNKNQTPFAFASQAEASAQILSLKDSSRTEKLAKKDKQN